MVIRSNTSGTAVAGSDVALEITDIALVFNALRLLAYKG